MVNNSVIRENGMIGFRNTELPDIIELKNITHSFDGKRNVIENFNLLIEDYPSQGQFVVLLGTSGCGKSTILSFMSGLQTPQQGEVLFCGQPNDKPFPMVFQKYSNLYWMSVLDNVLMSSKLRGNVNAETKDKAYHMLEKVGLADHANKYASDLLLSGGQLQRIAIARALMEDPKVILMDEPFGALDIYTRTQMQLLLQEIWEPSNMTIILVTHDISEAVFLGDDIYLMDSDPGRIVEHFKVNLPLHREREIRKTGVFTNLVGEIEDRLFKLNQAHKN